MARWTRCDEILVLDLYFKAERQILPLTDNRLTRVSDLIRKSDHSVQAKMANIKHLDPERSGGLSHPSSLNQEVWDEYSDDERRLRIAAATCRRKLRGR